MVITLKVDKFLSKEWDNVFWPFWIVFSLMIGISFTLLLVLIAKIFSSCCMKTTKSECIKFFNENRFWYFLVVLLLRWFYNHILYSNFNITRSPEES